MKTVTKKLGALAAALMITLCAGCNNDRGGVPDSGESNSASQGGEVSAPENGSSAPDAPDDSSVPDDSGIPEEWTELSQTEITAAMGMGWNLGNQLEASNNGTPSERAWNNARIEPELLKLVGECGFKTVRIPVSYLSKIGEGPDYAIDKEWLDRVEEVVNYVLDNDMFAIINIHGDGYYTVDGGWLLCAEDDGKQTEIKAKYEAVWRQIADRFKNYDERLIFESMNEEFDGTYGQPNPDAYANINAYNQIFVDTVRKTGANNTKRWLLMPGWNTNIGYTNENFGFVIPEDTLCESPEKRLMISVHYYDPYNFTINEDKNSYKTQWGKYAVEDAETSCGEKYIMGSFKRLSDNFVSQGYPVVIGELGVQDKSQAAEYFPEFRRYWTECVVSAAKQWGCIPVYWDNGYTGNKGFAVINRMQYTVTQPELIEAMMRAINAEEEYEIAAPAGFEKDDAAA